MKKNKIIAFALSVIMLLPLVSCGSSSDTTDTADLSDQIATAEEMTDVKDVTWEGMAAVTADQINDGEYEITVDSSSSMFNIEKCKLTVADGKLTALMTMGGTGYRYITMKSAEDAAAASESDYIYPEEDSEGNHTFTVDIAALDAPLKCAAFSDKKEKWYDRTLVFKSAGIPIDAFKEGVIVTAADLGLEDGEHTVEVSMTGGSGKASVDSPAMMTVSGGSCTAAIVWSSPNYDYMLVNGEKYLPVNEEGNSTFEIPVLFFDRPMAVVGDTTAMSEPHEIDYALTFNSKSVK